MSPGSLQLKLLLRSVPLRTSERGFAMPLVLPVLLLLIMGAVTLASRSTSSFLAASKQSDAQSARQAAESGMNRVLRSLSPYGKNASDPYLSFLLLSNWEKGKGVAGSGWALTQLGQGAVIARLQQCRISTRGLRETHLVPSSSQVYERLVSDVIGTTGPGKRTLRYRIVDYVPPQLANPSGWPSECADFSTVTGGSAQITVEGTVEINGKPLASQRLTRTIEVDGVPFPDLPNSFPVPGPPIGLRIGGTGSGSGLGTITSFVYTDFEANRVPVELTNKIGLLRPQCSNCSPPLRNAVTNNFPANSSDLPPFPVDQFGNPLVLPELPNPSPKDLTLIPPTAKKAASKLIDENTLSDPSFNCGLTRNRTEISCYIRNIRVNLPQPPKDLESPYTPPIAVLRVDTSRYPVNLYIDGNIGGAPRGPTNPSIIPPPEIPPKQAPDLSDGRVVIEHCLKNCTTDTRVLYIHTDPSLRPYWNRLRIFGSSRPQADPQVFYIASRSISADSGDSLSGAFLWLPQASRGKLIYGVPSYTYDPIAKIWTPSPERAPDEILTTWWLEELDLGYLTGNMRFILPLYGNPEAMGALLPGGYFNASGRFEEDPRFPVYPVLPRLRSTF